MEIYKQKIFIILIYLKYFETYWKKREERGVSMGNLTYIFLNQMFKDLSYLFSVLIKLMS